MSCNSSEINSSEVPVIVKVLTNEEIHSQKFQEYLYKNYEIINFILMFDITVLTKPIMQLVLDLL
jgi:hypothetical protein